MQGISIGKVKTLSIRSRSMQFDDDSSLFSKIAVLFMKLSKISSPNVIPILNSIPKFLVYRHTEHIYATTFKMIFFGVGKVISLTFPTSPHGSFCLQ